jgi:hypothetical protein
MRVVLPCMTCFPSTAALREQTSTPGRHTTARRRLRGRSASTHLVAARAAASGWLIGSWAPPGTCPGAQCRCTAACHGSDTPIAQLHLLLCAPSRDDHAPQQDAPLTRLLGGSSPAAWGGGSYRHSSSSSSSSHDSAGAADCVRTRQQRRGAGGWGGGRAPPSPGADSTARCRCCQGAAVQHEARTARCRGPPRAC